jgi:nucleoside-diphosphate-sugar epimerase
LEFSAIRPATKSSSTTSVFGDALVPPAGAPSAWITEDVRPIPKNIYGLTKAAAEDFVSYFTKMKVPCIVLRISRFFPEEDFDRAATSRVLDHRLTAAAGNPQRAKGGGAAAFFGLLWMSPRTDSCRRRADQEAVSVDRFPSSGARKMPRPVAQ